MILCPDCRLELNINTLCHNCDWELDYHDGIANLLKNKLSTVMQEYFNNYDRISNDDLKISIQPKNALEQQARTVANTCKVEPNDRVCDIGGGQGFLSRELKKKGVSDITVIDIAIPYLKKLKNDFKAIIADAENIPFQEEFDIIYATDILEHVINMGSFLYCVNVALKPKGKFIVRVPVDENIMAYSPHLGCKYDFVHLRSFNKSLLKKQLRDAGFKIVKTKYEYYWYNIPKNYILKNKLLNKVYDKILTVYSDYFSRNNYLVNDTTLLKKAYCKMFLRPICLTCLVEKDRELK